jgi:hypothetical protein
MLFLKVFLTDKNIFSFWKSGELRNVQIPAIFQIPALSDLSRLNKIKRMRDHQKLVGLTAHQNSSEMNIKLQEHTYKPPANIRKKEKLPPSDYYGKVSLEILDSQEPFSLFLWFGGEGVCIVDLMIDGKKSNGWILNSGRKNGVQVTDIVIKGSRIPLGFRPRGLIQGNADHIKF